MRAPDPRTNTGVVMVGLPLRGVRVFRHFAWLEVGSVKNGVVSSRPPALSTLVRALRRGATQYPYGA